MRTPLARHDTWNMWALGTLNLLHAAWMLSGTPKNLQTVLALAGAAYMLIDSLWLIASPTCVANRNWKPLLAHHAAICCLIPSMLYDVVFDHNTLIRHALRCWIAEYSSWTHIAARATAVDRPIISNMLENVNKPMFVFTRLICWPIVYLLFDRERTLLGEAAHVTPLMHRWVFAVHALLYCLMIYWGWGLMTKRPRKSHPVGKRAL